ncbi:MAG: hypothetical protein DRH97_07850 [Chloroflexi bacterium]|nr:MAG: hypothetical protein DRH97_07850 [Chloroflexota bacterium]
MPEKQVFKVLPLSKQDDFDENGLAAIMGIFQKTGEVDEWGNDIYKLTKGTPAQFGELVSRPIGVWAPDQLTQVLEGTPNSVNLINRHASDYRGIFASRGISIDSGEAYNIVIPKQNFSGEIILRVLVGSGGAFDSGIIESRFSLSVDTTTIYRYSRKNTLIDGNIQNTLVVGDVAYSAVADAFIIPIHALSSSNVRHGVCLEYVSADTGDAKAMINGLSLSAVYLAASPPAMMQDLQYGDVKVEGLANGTILRTTGDVSVQTITANHYRYTVNNATTLGYAQASINDDVGANSIYDMNAVAIPNGNVIDVYTGDAYNSDDIPADHTLTFKIID